MADTTHLQLPLLASAQAQKHVTHNDALLRLDAIIQLSVLDRDLTSPPAAPSNGDRYIPASGATGAWAAWDLNVAWYVDGVWTKLVPREGWRLWVDDEDVLLVWDGAAWQQIEGGGGGGREVLSAARTYFVDPAGSNANDRLSAGAAFQTLQKAVDVVAALDMGTHQVTIQMQNGTHTAPAELKPYVGLNAPIIVGDEATPSNVFFHCTSPSSGAAILADASGEWHVRGMKLQVTTGGRGLLARNGSVIRFQNLDFGACPAAHMYPSANSTIEATGNYSISGGSVTESHWIGNGWIICNGRTITLSNTPNFGLAFAFAGRGAVLDVTSNTFSGTGATGKRFATHLNGVIFVAGANPNTYFPGDVAGTEAAWDPVQ